MQLTQHAEVGGLEGQESSASSLWSLTRGGVGWGGQQRTDSGPGHHQVIRPGGLASFLLLPTPGLAYQTPPGTALAQAPAVPGPSQTRTPPPPRPSAGAGSPAAYPVLQLRGELGLELAAGATAVVSLNEDLPGHRRLLRPHGEDRTGRAAGSGDTNHGHTPGLDPGLRPPSPADPPSAQSGQRPPGPTPLHPCWHHGPSAPSPAQAPRPPTARFGPGNTNPPPLPSSCCRNAYASTYVLPQKASSSPTPPRPSARTPTSSLGPTLSSGRKAILLRLRATVRGRAVGGAREDSAPRPARRSPAGRKRQGGAAGRVRGRVLRPGRRNCGPCGRGRRIRWAWRRGEPCRLSSSEDTWPVGWGFLSCVISLLCHFLIRRADRVSNH